MENLSGYKEKYLSVLKRSHDIATELDIKNIITLSKKVAARVKDDLFRIVVLGEFNRGKSTLLNALIGEDILPTAEQETTATINIIKYADLPHIKIFYNDGRTKTEEFKKEILKNFTALEDFDPRNIKYIEIGYHSEYLRNNVEIVDTPGVNDPDEHRSEITFNYIPNSDAIIFVLDAKQAFTMSEKRFANEYILQNKLTSIFFILNKIDEVSEGNLEKIKESVNKKIQEASSIENPMIFPVSSLDALNAKLNYDTYAFNRSGMENFIEGLNTFLSSDQKIKAKANTLKGIILSVLKTLDDSVGMSLTLSRKSVDELEKIKVSINSEQMKYRAKLDDIIKKMETELGFVEDAIENKLFDKYSDFKELLYAEIKTYRGNLKDFAEAQIPLRYKRFLKEWTERNSENIDRQLKTIAFSATTEYEKEFSRKTIIHSDSLQRNYQMEIPAVSFEIELKDSEVNEKIALGAGATLLAGATIIFTGGVALIPMMIAGYSGGLAGKNIYNTLFSKKILESQKNLLYEGLDNLFNKDFKELNAYLKLNIRERFDDLKRLLQQQFDNTLTEISDELDKRLKAYDARKDIQRQKIEVLVTRQNEVTTLIHTLN